MAEPLPSLDLVADEVRSERDAQIRHADAVDAKAGIILGFSGAVAALTARDLDGARAPGLIAAVLAALACLFVLLPRRFPTWELQDLRKYLRADREFTRLRTVGTGIVICRECATRVGQLHGRHFGLRSTTASKQPVLRRAQTHEGGMSVTASVAQRTPCCVVRICELLACRKVLAIATSELRSDGIDVIDERAEKGQIPSLSIWCVVDRDRLRLDDECAGKCRPGQFRLVITAADSD
jgi:hypothetical protein